MEIRDGVIKADGPKVGDLIKQFGGPQGLSRGLVEPRPQPMPTFVRAPDPNLASGFHERLKKMVEQFDQSLDQEHEVGIRLVSFGQTVTFHLESIGYWNPSLITFNGMTTDGEPVQLIQHVSQISILLMKMRRRDPSQPKRPIGFCGSEQLCDEGSAEIESAEVPPA